MDAPANAARDTCSLVLESVRADTGEIELGVPGTEYRLFLRCAVDPATLRPAGPGRRVRGSIHGQALKLFRAHAGGRFIEPLWGHPRIVQGTVVDADAAANRLLVDMVVPAWLSLEPGQTVSEFPRGTLVNMYLASGLEFRPVG